MKAAVLHARQPCFEAIRSSDLAVAESEGYTSGEYTRAVTETNASDKHPLREFYKTQSLQYLGEENDGVPVPIWIADCNYTSSEFLSVGQAWTRHIQQAIRDINRAAPGLHLYTVSDRSKAKVTIAGTETDESCYTVGNILRNPTAEIYLRLEWNDKKGTSCHELLHALGFGHEHQRRDRDHSVDVNTHDSQCCKLDDLYGVTRFDPYSIMLYPEEYFQRSDDPVWFTKPSHQPNVEMSELDKVGLNNLYRPCKRSGYSPAMGSTGLFYCGSPAQLMAYYRDCNFRMFESPRYIGVQSPGHDGRCGPNNGVNCPACRVLKTDRVVSLWQKDKWQGWTGAIYCGYYFGVQCEGHDGYCGPNNGPQCPECYNEHLRRY